jgi:hypothetical protein
VPQSQTNIIPKAVYTNPPTLGIIHPQANPRQREFLNLILGVEKVYRACFVACLSEKLKKTDGWMFWTLDDGFAI